MIKSKKPVYMRNSASNSLIRIQKLQLIYSNPFFLPYGRQPRNQTYSKSYLIHKSLEEYKDSIHFVKYGKFSTSWLLEHKPEFK